MKRDPISKYAVKETRLRLKHFSTNLRRAAKHPEDPEAIHDLRVSIRRVVQAFKTFCELLDPAPVRKLRKRLHKLMDLCAAVRNCDVALGLLEQVGLSAGKAVSRLKKTRAEAGEKLRRRLRVERRKHHVAPDNRSHTKELDWKLDQSLETNLCRALPALAEEFFDSGRAALSLHASYRTLHKFRLQAKRFRYTLELFESFYGSEMVSGAGILKELQDRLGAINDCAATMDLLGRDSAAVAAVGKLLRQRKVVLRTYALSQFAPEKLNWWQRWLAQPAPRDT